MVLKSPLALQPLPGTIALFPPPLPLALQPLPWTHSSIPSPYPLSTPTPPSDLNLYSLPLPPSDICL